MNDAVEIFYNDICKEKQDILKDLAQIKDITEENWDIEPVITLHKNGLQKDANAEYESKKRYRKRNQRTELWFHEITEEKQNLLLKMAGITKPKDKNWDKEAIVIIDKDMFAPVYETFDDPWNE